MECFLNVFLYADDIILNCNTLSAMLNMPNICERFAEEMDLYEICGDKNALALSIRLLRTSTALRCKNAIC